MTARHIMALRSVRVIRWSLVLCNQAGILSFLVSSCVAAGASSSIWDNYLDWYMKFYQFFVLPAVFANGVNGFVLMVEGRIRVNWPWWRQLLTLFAISLPVYGVFHYARCLRELSSATTPARDKMA
jgi:hypothetical protein